MQSLSLKKVAMPNNISPGSYVASIPDVNHSPQPNSTDIGDVPNLRKEFSGLSNSSQRFVPHTPDDREIGESPVSQHQGNKAISSQLSANSNQSSAESSDVSIEVEQIEKLTKDLSGITTGSSVPNRSKGERSKLSSNIRKRLCPISTPITQALRVGLCTGAGRTASWLVNQNLPSSLGSMTAPLGIGTSILRSGGTYALIHNASRSVESKLARRAARVGGVLCSALMLAPALYVGRNPSSALAKHILRNNMADLAYVAVRDPLQNMLRNFGPRVSLSAKASPGSPNLPAFVPLSVVYAVSAALWLLAFKTQIDPVSLTLGPLAYSAIHTIAPAAVIEATEAAASTVIFSAFPGSLQFNNFSIEIPQPHVFLTTAAMRIFATGLLQLGNYVAHLFFDMPEGMPIIAFGIVMFFLEWLGAVAQQAIVNISAIESQNPPITEIDTHESESDGIRLQSR